MSNYPTTSGYYWWKKDKAWVIVKVILGGRMSLEDSVEWMGSENISETYEWVDSDALLGLDEEDADAARDKLTQGFFERWEGEWGSKIEQYKPEGDTDEQV